MYKLFTDNLENFEAKIRLEGASLKKSKARLVIDSTDFDLLFKGSIDESGRVKVPITRLKGLLDENTQGTIKLEVIAEDTYFTPWESTFKVEASRKVTVEVVTQKEKSEKETLSEVEIISQPTISEKQHIINIVKMLVKEDINIENLSIKKTKVNSIIAEYIQDNPIQENQRTQVIDKVVKILEKKK